MKKVILLMAMCLGMFACGNSNAKGNKTSEEQPQKDHVEVLYFHGKQRCATCMAIEKNAKEAIEEQFADELKNGTVVFKTIDISEPENEAVADKYEVTWSSLFICNWKDGKETYENLTEYAFANARTAPDTFKSGVIEKVKTLLK
ncbi:nitrophenyl compound nitroreductase subunit ArsF family protein [Alistipes putredinis]|uniref:nitrophenyl compound nitroreductase subunit ArsF family protein n=1 Tax=Alistipes putredinis TaxID=28117 RepID=UPI00242E197A|nr:nitrophenyl compound nitroreductase subunit ArsF family protein [Alistipes putredinis]